tara:strand:- start:33 stop:239 length:207 start_codon:yes stop_codon:yes gene_type:complete
MHGRTEICQSNEVLEVRNSGITSPMIEVVNKRGSVGRHKDTVVATDAYTAFRVSCELGIFAGYTLADD